MISKTLCSILTMSSFFAVNIVLFAQGALSQQITAEEIINKHIQAVGGKETLAKAKSRLALGTSEFVQRSLGQKVTGRAVLASNGSDYAWYCSFDLQEYSKERIGIFENKKNIPFLQQGMRAPLGRYLLSNDRVLADRLFGGAIFPTWRLFNLEQNEGKFEADGKKKLNGKETLVVRYRPKSGLRAGSSIRLYFDAQTFNHIRTEMKLSEPDKGFYEINGRQTEMGPGMASNGSSLIEDFDDFKSVIGLTLPHKYIVDLTLDGLAGTAQFKWNVQIVEYRVVNDFGKDFFTFSS